MAKNKLKMVFFRFMIFLMIILSFYFIWYIIHGLLYLKGYYRFSIHHVVQVFVCLAVAYLFKMKLDYEREYGYTEKELKEWHKKHPISSWRINKFKNKDDEENSR